MSVATCVKFAATAALTSAACAAAPSAIRVNAASSRRMDRFRYVRTTISNLASQPRPRKRLFSTGHHLTLLHGGDVIGDRRAGLFLHSPIPRQNNRAIVAEAR